ncbi:MAG: hypothetical protein ACOYOS_10250 [Syntrophales bacterium]
MEPVKRKAESGQIWKNHEATRENQEEQPMGKSHGELLQPEPMKKNDNE